MLYTHRTTSFVVILFSILNLTIVSSDKSSILPTDSSSPLWHGRAVCQEWPKQLLPRKGKRKEEVESAIYSMAIFDGLREKFGSNHEIRTRINEEQRKCVQRYHEIGRDQTSLPKNLEYTENSAFNFSIMHFNLECAAKENFNTDADILLALQEVENEALDFPY